MYLITMNKQLKNKSNRKRKLINQIF